MIFPFKLNSMPPLMTLKQVSDVLFDNDSNANCQAVRRFIKRGQFPAPTIPAINKGGTMFFSRQDIIDWYDQELNNENKSSVEGSSLTQQL
jgi:hypothetical protein